MREWLSLLTLSAWPAFAQVAPHVVISKTPESIAVTVYADDLALVREQRSVELPLGFSIVEFRGVSDAIVSQAAFVEGLAGVAERNFDYDLLSPYALVSEGIGQRVTLVRTSPGSGAVTRESATIAAGGEGVVLDFGDGRVEGLECSGLPEGLVFEAAPADLRAQPTLSARVHNERAGRQTLTLVYLVHGVSWRADYNVVIRPSGDRFDLEAWITLTNDGGTNFADAEVAVVAGELNRREDGTPIIDFEALEEHCWAWGRRWPGFWSAPAPVQAVAQTEFQGLPPERGIEEIVVTARKRAEVGQTEAQREELLDYHFYRIPWRTTVAARQAKQVRFLTRRGVRSDWSYLFWNPSWIGADETVTESAEILLRFRNEKANQLGEPLPEGTLRAAEKLASMDVFLLGEGELGNTAADLPVEATLGESALVMGELRVTDHREELLLIRSLMAGEAWLRTTATLEREIANAKPHPVLVEVRQEPVDSLRISNTTHPWKRDRGVPTWRIEVPANERVTLRYRVQFVQRP